MRISVCELPDSRLEFEPAWDNLVQHVRFAESGLVVLPELPAASWFGATPDFDQGRWDAVVAAHERLTEGLSAFGSAVVVSSIAETAEGVRRNTAVVWSSETGLVRLHAKTTCRRSRGSTSSRGTRRATSGPRFTTLVASGWACCCARS